MKQILKDYNKEGETLVSCSNNRQAVKEGRKAVVLVTGEEKKQSLEEGEDEKQVMKSKKREEASHPQSSESLNFCSRICRDRKHGQRTRSEFFQNSPRKRTQSEMKEKDLYHQTSL